MILKVSPGGTCSGGSSGETVLGTEPMGEDSAEVLWLVPCLPACMNLSSSHQSMPLACHYRGRVPGHVPVADNLVPADWLQGERLGQQLWQAGAALSRAQDQLAQAQAELVQAWQDGNHSQEEAESRNVEVSRLQEQLNMSLRSHSRAWPCQVTGTLRGGGQGGKQGTPMGVGLGRIALPPSGSTGPRPCGE